MLFCFRHILLSASFLVVAMAFQNCTRVNPSEVDTLSLLNPEVGGLDGVLEGGNLPSGVETGSGGSLPQTPPPVEQPLPVEQPPADEVAGEIPMPESPALPPSPVPVETPDPFDTCAECTASFFSQKTQAEEACYQGISHISYPLSISNDAKDVSRQIGLSVNIKEARAIIIRKVLGSVQIEKAQSLDVSNVGSLSARVNEVIGATAMRGGVCLGAGRVQIISDIKGQVNVAAQEIGEISDVSSNVRIYGGTVHTLKNIQGHVCLHNNAQVLSYSNIAGGIKNCD